MNVNPESSNRDGDPDGDQAKVDNHDRASSEGSVSDGPVAEAWQLLRGVVDPELGADIVELSMVSSVSLEHGVLMVKVMLTTAACPLRAQLRDDVVRRLSNLDGVSAVKVSFSEMTPEQRSLLMARARRHAQQRPVTHRLAPTTRVLAIWSGKGGVGKSTVSTGLAHALAHQGFSVGLLDADVWGFSIPRLTGTTGRLKAERGPQGLPLIQPLRQRVGEGLLEIVSTGLLLDDPDTALMWRGLMLNRAVQHFLDDVAWGALDYLIIDMPPGTGDVAMGLARMVPQTDVVLVTTADPAAAEVAARAGDMARRCHLRIAGVVETMSTLTCSHGGSVAPFGSGGGGQVAEAVGAPLVAQIPLVPPSQSRVVLERCFDDLARRVCEELSPPMDLSTCTSRLLRALEQAAESLD